MNVTLCSAFRNSEKYLSRYFAQIDALDRLLTERGDTLTLVLGYGDSTDATDALLFEQTSGGAIGALLVDCTHGGAVYGSIVDAQRFKQLAYVANKLLANVPDDASMVVYVESDLAWEPSTLLTMIEHLRMVDCVAPMIMHAGGHWLYPGSGPFFYDTLAFIRNGRHFTNELPYYPSLPRHELVVMDSVGSCIAMKAHLAHQARFSPDDVIIGFCTQIRALGATIWLDPRLSVFHN